MGSLWVLLWVQSEKVGLFVGPWTTIEPSGLLCLQWMDFVVLKLQSEIQGWTRLVKVFLSFEQPLNRKKEEEIVDQPGQKGLVTGSLPLA